MKINEELVLRASTGDKTAFGDLYKACYTDFYKFAVYTLGNCEDAADAVSDAFLDIWKGLGSLREPSAFQSWSMRILSLKCKKLIGRIIEKRNTYDLDEIIETPAEPGESIEESVTEGTMLSKALGMIDPEDRMLITLSVLHGYKNKEISDMLGMPPGTVSSRLYRAYEKLRKIMGGENDG